MAPNEATRPHHPLPPSLSDLKLMIWPFGWLGATLKTRTSSPLMGTFPRKSVALLGPSANLLLAPSSAYHGHLTSMIDISSYKFLKMNGGKKKKWVHVVSWTISRTLQCNSLVPSYRRHCRALTEANLPLMTTAKRKLATCMPKRFTR